MRGVPGSSGVGRQDRRHAVTGDVPRRIPVRHHGPMQEPTKTVARTASAPGAISSSSDVLVKIVTQRLLSGIPASFGGGSPPREDRSMQLFRVMCGSSQRKSSRKSLRTATMISVVVFPKLVMVSAAERKGNIAPSKTQLRTIG